MPVSLALADAPVLAQDGGGLVTFLPFILVFVIFWLLVFRPASKDRKQREEKIRNLRKHDRVVTNAGIHGTVVALDTDTVTLRVDERANVRIVFSRSAIWQVSPEAGGVVEVTAEPEESPSR